MVISICLCRHVNAAFICCRGDREKKFETISSLSGIYDIYLKGPSAKWSRQWERIPQSWKKLPKTIHLRDSLGVHRQQMNSDRTQHHIRRLATAKHDHRPVSSVMKSSVRFFCILSFNLLLKNLRDESIILLCLFCYFVWQICKGHLSINLVCD